MFQLTEGEYEESFSKVAIKDFHQGFANIKTLKLSIEVPAVTG